MIINVLSLLLTVLGLVTMAKSESPIHGKGIITILSYVLGAAVGFMAWKTAMGTAWWLVSTPIKFIISLF